MNPDDQNTISYTELPAAKPDDPLGVEAEIYRREVGRLLADGNEGQFVLIKGGDIIGIWATEAEARQVAYQRFPLQAVFIHQVRSREPLLRAPLWMWFSTCPR